MTLQELIDHLVSLRKLGATSVWLERSNGDTLDITDLRLHLTNEYVVIEVSE